MYAYALCVLSAHTKARVQHTDVPLPVSPFRMTALVGILNGAGTSYLESRGPWHFPTQRCSARMTQKLAFPRRCSGSVVCQCIFNNQRTRFRSRLSSYHYHSGHNRLACKLQLMNPFQGRPKTLATIAIVCIVLLYSLFWSEATTQVWQLSPFRAAPY